MIPTTQELAGAVARGWCYPQNSHKEMDADLANAITKELEALFASPQSAPNLAVAMHEIMAEATDDSKEPRNRLQSVYAIAGNALRGVPVSAIEPRKP